LIGQYKDKHEYPIWITLPGQVKMSRGFCLYKNFFWERDSIQ